MTAGTKRPAEKEHAGSPQRKKVKFVGDTKVDAKKPSTKENASSTSRTPSSDAKPKSKKKEPTALEKLAARTAGPSFSGATPLRKGRSQQEKHEDAYIEYLESKLGWNKAGSRTNKYGKGLEEDGLDGAPLVYSQASYT